MDPNKWSREQTKPDTLKKYTFRGSYPQEMSPIELSYASNDEIERFTVTFAYQYYDTETTS